MTSQRAVSGRLVGQPLTPELTLKTVWNMSDLKYLVAMHGIDGIGMRRMARLESHFGSMSDAWHANRGELRDAGIGSTLAEGIYSTRDVIDPDAEMECLIRRGIRPIHIRSEDYPELLAASPDPPPVIYVSGELEPQDANCVAIVGTRDASSYGIEMASRLSYDLASMGITIASGLAIGIDTAAHRAALKAGGRTIAVLAGGLDSIYPQRNRPLARQITESGCLISEYKLGERCKREHFPLRNRIISGLSRGVIVVEAAKKSGAKWTVKWALEQNREVFAVPGNVTSHQSEGTNWLIQQGAKLTTCADDVLQELSAFFGDLQRDPQAVQRNARSSISRTVRGADQRNGNERPKTRQYEHEEVELENDIERQIARFLSQSDEPSHVDEVARSLSMNISDVMSSLTMMEVRGVVKCTEGALYRLSNRRVQIDAPRLLDDGTNT